MIYIKNRTTKMHTGIISFCDRISYNIKCTDAKDAILDQLENMYKIRIIQKHWLRLDDTQLKYVKQLPHDVCIRSNGNPYFLYFTRYDDVSQIMYIDKKVQPGYQKPRIILTRGQFDDCIFDNTLVEGEMVKDVKDQWLFLINDVIMYKGVYLKDIPLPERLSCAYEMLENYYKPDTIMDVCSYQVKKYVKCTRSAIRKIIEFSKLLPYTSRGIYFVPHSMKYKPKLINFNDDLIKAVYRKVKDVPDFVEKISEPVDSDVNVCVNARIDVVVTNHQETTTPELDENSKLVWLRKTDQPDIYDLYENENSQEKYGIAYVPTMAISKMLRNVFKNINVVTSVCFLCKYDTNFQKWVPIRVVSS